MRAMGLSRTVLWLGWFLSCLGPFLVSAALLVLVLKVRDPLSPPQAHTTRTRGVKLGRASPAPISEWNPESLVLFSARGHPSLQPPGCRLLLLGGLRGGHRGSEFSAQRLLLQGQPGSCLWGPRLLRPLPALRAVCRLARAPAPGRPCSCGEGCSGLRGDRHPQSVASSLTHSLSP